MKVVIAGNGILALMTAYKLQLLSKEIEIILVGPDSKIGSASLAAAAMFNSFCEVDTGTFSNQLEKQKFLFNRKSVPMWPALLEEIQAESQQVVEHGFGTFLINNHMTDEVEDKNFIAIREALKEFSEPFESVDPREIKNFKPSAKGRSTRAMYIPREGWVNPVSLTHSLETILKRNKKVQFINDQVTRINWSGSKINGFSLATNQEVFGDKYLLASGANVWDLLQASHLQLKIPRLYYGVGCSVLLKTGEDTLTNCVRTPNRGLACGVYAAPHNKNDMLIGASNFICPYPEEAPRITSVHSLLGSAMEQINSNYYRAQLLKVNLGWRPTSEDTMPLIGPTSIDNLLIATGTKRDGLHCSPYIGEYLSELLVHGSSQKDFSSYRPERELMRIYNRQEAIQIAIDQTINAAYQHGYEPAKNRMTDELREFYRREFEALHDKVGALTWGIPPELLNMYKYGHFTK